jgi:predicted nucleic acid-binding protein
MRYVLDSSVAFKWEVKEADSNMAIRLRDESRRGLHELIAPDVFMAELAHAMTRAERQGRVSKAHGWGLLLGILADAPVFHSYPRLVPRAYAIVELPGRSLRLLLRGLGRAAGLFVCHRRRPTRPQPSTAFPVDRLAQRPPVSTVRGTTIRPTVRPFFSLLATDWAGVSHP